METTNPKTAAPPMRTWEEVQWAHDLIAPLVGDEPLFRAVIPKKMQPALVSAVDVLCWVLNHEDGENFILLLRALYSYHERSEEFLELPGDLEKAAKEGLLEKLP